MLSSKEIKPAIKALKFIFWGGILCIFDITVSSLVNGQGYKFDFLNDFVGMLMITFSVFSLSKIMVSNAYQSRMLFVKVISVLACVDTFHSHFIYDSPVLFSYMSSILGICTLIAIVIFCSCMLELSQAAGLVESIKKWRTTRTLFIVIYLIPLGLFYIAGLIAMITGKSFNINLGVGGFALLAVFFVPLYFILKSSSTMKREIEGDEASNISMYENTQSFS